MLPPRPAVALNVYAPRPPPHVVDTPTLNPETLLDCGPPRLGAPDEPYAPETLVSAKSLSEQVGATPPHGSPQRPNTEPLV
jgi:hypothetical protein